MDRSLNHSIIEEDILESIAEEISSSQVTDVFDSSKLVSSVTSAPASGSKFSYGKRNRSPKRGSPSPKRKRGFSNHSDPFNRYVGG